MNWKIFAFVSLVLVSCSTSKQTGSSGTTPIYVPQKEQTPSKEEEKKTSDKQQQDSSVTTEEKKVENVSPVIKDKSSYNIAVLLPFMTDKVPLNYTPYQVDTNIYLSPETQQSLDFYMGLKLAVDDFRNNGKKFNVFVLDDANSDYQTRKVLSERPFPEVDIIISGTSNRISKEILKYSEDKKVPVFSPFTSEISQASELFYSALPNSMHQIEQLFVKLQSLYPEAPVQIIQDPNDDSSFVVVKSIEHFLKNELNIVPEVIKNTQSVVKETGESLSFFQPTSSTIVFIASNKEAFVKSTLPKLYGTSHPTYILGMPSWSGFRGLENEVQPNPAIYIPTFNFASRSKADKENFAGRFTDEFQIEDNNNVYLGYDLMNYVMTSADQGRLSENLTTTQLGLKPYYYNFDFIPVNHQKGILYFTNSQVGFLKYEKGRFSIVKL